MSNMGARVARMFRNVNLENRVMREISREKPAPAPRYPAEETPAGGSSCVGVWVCCQVTGPTLNSTFVFPQRRACRSPSTRGATPCSPSWRPCMWSPTTRSPQRSDLSTLHLLTPPNTTLHLTPHYTSLHLLTPHYTILISMIRIK